MPTTGPLAETGPVCVVERCELGVPPKRADDLAVVVIAALEGAIILARIRRDLTPFDALVRELGPLLDEVARPAADRTGRNMSQALDR